MAKARRVMYVRKFLNRPGFQSSAHIIAKVTRGKNYRGGLWWDYELRIGDCDRKIDLEFDIGSSHDRANTLYKIETLVDTLTRLRDKIYEGIEDLEREAQDTQ